MIKKTFLFIFAFCVYNFSFAQKASIHYCQNLTKFDYKDSNGYSNPNLRGDSGSAFEIEYEMPLKKYKKIDLSKFNYTFGISFDHYNAKGGDLNNSYNWKTSYIGVNNNLSYCVYQYGEDLKLIANGGFGFATIIKGEQSINGVVYNIIKEKEFSGIMIKPFAGIDISYQLTENIQLKLGYTLSRSMRLFNKNDEKLAFNNNQVQLGLYFPLK